MLLQAALNGPHTKAHHPSVPITADELARDAAACFAEGARAIHLHPRDDDGAERLEPEVVDRVVLKVRGACGVPVGVSTGAWIEPDHERLVELVKRWRAPDFASVNLSEDGAAAVMRALRTAEVGIEAGVWSVEDVERLAASGFADGLVRVLVEPVDLAADQALGVVAEIHGALDRLGVQAPRLQHGDGAATWVLVEDAVRRGADTRVGLEDTLEGSNPELVRRARELGAGRA